LYSQEHIGLAAAESPVRSITLNQGSDFSSQGREFDMNSHSWRRIDPAKGQFSVS
jgi:hypothetical protein